MELVREGTEVGAAALHRGQLGQSPARKATLSVAPSNVGRASTGGEVIRAGGRKGAGGDDAGRWYMDGSPGRRQQDWWQRR